jgi:hypothetical protein
VVTDLVASTVSSSATLTILILLTPVITDPPVSQAVVARGSVTWSVGVTGNPLPLGFE